MENKFVKFERFADADQNAVDIYQEQEHSEDDDEEEEEALSFCDLPLDHLSRKEDDEEEERIPLLATDQAQEDFRFCYLSKDSAMCDAKEVFFQGQILPFRHSLSSGEGKFRYHRSISKSESIDGSSSITLFSSRSSSISSSNCSYSSRGSAAATLQWFPNRQQSLSHSHRSKPHGSIFPAPGIIRTNNGLCSKKTSSSSVWSILRLGILVTSPPEIAFDCKKFRGRNCTGRSSGNNKIIIPDSTQKKKSARGFLGGGCHVCSSDDAVDTVRSRVAGMKKSAREMEKQPAKSARRQAAKKQGNHRRTFEWLKQLSLEDTEET